MYFRYEHGWPKDRAVLRADGTCTYTGSVATAVVNGVFSAVTWGLYDGEACRADYAPFVALQATVVPIKARPRTSAPTAFLYAAFIPQPSPPNRSNRPLFGTRRSWRRPTPTRCAPAASAVSLRGPCGTATAKQMHRASSLDVAPGGRMHHACATTACVVHPSAVRARAANPHMPPLFPSRAARPRGASRPAAGCTFRFCTPRAAHTRRPRASRMRFAPRTCTPAPSHAPNCDAHSMRP